MLSEFNYSFKWVDDSKYGKKDKETGEWNGMMGELLAQVRNLSFHEISVKNQNIARRLIQPF